MGSHLRLKNTPPVMRDDEKAVEHSEGRRRDGKEIHRSDGFPMIAKKGRPCSMLEAAKRGCWAISLGGAGKDCYFDIEGEYECGRHVHAAAQAAVA